MKIDSQKIKNELKELGICQSELARQAGISRQSVSILLKRGSGRPQTVEKITKAMSG